MIGTPLTNSITKYGRPESVVPTSSTRAMLRVIHQRQRLPLRLEAGDDLGRIHARLDDLEGDGSPDRLLLLGHVNHAEAAFADLLQQLVRPNDAAIPFGRRSRQ